MVVNKKKIIEILLNSIQTNFDQEGRPSWIKSRLAQLESRKTLTRTGRLRNSLKSTSVGNIIEISTSVFYGRFHQYGTKRLPARPWLVIQSEDIESIKAIIINDIISGWRKK